VFRQITVVLLATLVFTVFLSTQYSFAKKVECADGFTLCELSKCIDHKECTERDAVNWQKFENSPAYELSYDDQKKCLETAHKDGNGKDGLVGYEILSCGMGEDRY
jgi:hypothetical protein